MIGIVVSVFNKPITDGLLRGVVHAKPIPFGTYQGQASFGMLVGGEAVDNGSS